MKRIYVDEVGCSSIAGPVLCCAVAIEPEYEPVDGVQDSKKLTKKKRTMLFDELSKFPHSYGTASPRKIEKLNIFYAKFEAMRIAIEKLLKYTDADKVIVDGNFTIPNLNFPQECIIKADDKIWQVGVASILAKVKRDMIMEELSKIEKYSHYGFETNAGYYTPKHRLGIMLNGGTELHRKNFKYYQYCLAKREEYLKNGNIEIKKGDFTSWRDNQKDLFKIITYKETL